MAFLIALLLSFGPAFACALLLYWIDRYEKEVMVLLGAVFTGGAVIALVATIGLQILVDGAGGAASGSQGGGASVAGSSIVAPLVQEGLKGIAVLLVFVVLRRDFNSRLNGAYYAMVTALGFTATAGFFTLIGISTEQGIAEMARSYLAKEAVRIWDSPFFTAFFGIGLALSRIGRSRLVRGLAGPLGWATAVGVHIFAAVRARAAAPDGIERIFLDWKSWIFVVLVMLIASSREASLVRRQLEEEVEAQRLSFEQARIATSGWSRLFARLGAMTLGRAKITARFYEVCSQLAHTKERLGRAGEDEEAAERIAELRAELATLAPQVAGASEESSMAPPTSTG